MSPRGRKALGRYVAGLDALALSQYMDLTVVVPASAGSGARRLPTADEVAEALRRHERNFRQRHPRAGAGPAAGPDPAAARGGVRRGQRRPPPPQPLGRRSAPRSRSGTRPGDRPRPRGPGALPVAGRGPHRPQRGPVGHRHPLRHLRLAQPRLGHPRAPPPPSGNTSSHEAQPRRPRVAGPSRHRRSPCC